jgi:hypothetical protein
VAVTGWDVTEDEDVRSIPTSMFLTDEAPHEHFIGPGDEVFIMGLFTKMYGCSRNIPIVRTGNVAMMPGEMLPDVRIGGWRGEAEAYLVEARSIGGLSGSPTFVRETVSQTLTIKSRTRARRGQTQVPGDFYLLGLMHGHWSILPEDRNKAKIIADKSPDRVNLGIAVVVPAKKILEVLNHPELVKIREASEEETLQAAGPTEPDHGFVKNKGAAGRPGRRKKPAEGHES